MAQLKNTLISGDLRVTGTIYGYSKTDHTHGVITSTGYAGTASNKALYTVTSGSIAVGTLPVAAGGTGQTSIANIQAGKDGNGNTISSTYLKLSGGKMTGPLTWSNNTALPEFSGSPTYILGIEAFADGGTTKWAKTSSVVVGNADTAKWLMNRGGSTVSIADSTWAHNQKGRGGTNTSSGTVWKQKWTQSGLTYTPSGGSATNLTDSGDIVYWLSQDSTSNNLWVNMAIDGYIYSHSGFKMPVQTAAYNEGIRFVNSSGTDKGSIGTDSNGILGVYSSSKIVLRAELNQSTKGLEISTTAVYPTQSGSMTLGDSSHKWSTVYATTFSGNATSATEFSSNASVTLTGDTTGSASSKKGWSIATLTKYLSSVGRKTTAAQIAVNPSVDTGFKLTWHLSDSTSRTNDATNSPSFDGAILNFPWDWGGYNGQIALVNTTTTPRMQIRSATSVDNGADANPRYTPSYGAWREVVTATKATQLGSGTKGVYVSNTGQITEMTYTLSKSVPSNAVFTDTQVSQSATTTSNWRKILLHVTADAAATTAVSTATGGVYGAQYISAQPSTGAMRANLYYITDSAHVEYNSTTKSLDFIFA